MGQAVLVLVVEVRIEAVVVEIDRHAGVVGHHGALVERLRLGRVPLAAALGPVVAVAAQGHDGAAGIELAQGLGEVHLEPALARGRAWVAGQPVLVIGHQHHGVGGGLQGLEVPAAVVERDGHPHFAAGRLQGRTDLGQEGGVGLHRGVRQFLQIEDIAGEAALFGLVGQLGDQGLAGGGVEDVGRGLGGVPHAVVDVGDRGQHRRRLGRAAQDDVGLGIVDHGDVAGRAVQRHPLG